MTPLILDNNECVSHAFSDQIHLLVVQRHVYQRHDFQSHVFDTEYRFLKPVIYNIHQVKAYVQTNGMQSLSL
jgi:hypothetical protein